MQQDGNDSKRFGLRLQRTHGMTFRVCDHSTKCNLGKAGQESINVVVKCICAGKLWINICLNVSTTAWEMLLLNLMTPEPDLRESCYRGRDVRGHQASRQNFLDVYGQVDYFAWQQQCFFWSISEGNTEEVWE